MQEFDLKRLGIAGVALLIATLFWGCLSDQRSQQLAVERARKFLIKNSPELTTEQIYFVKFTDPVLLVGDEVSSLKPSVKVARNLFYRPICPVWMIPGRKQLYLVYGASNGRMEEWWPVRLIHKNYWDDAFKEFNLALGQAQQFAVTNYYDELTATQLNAIRLKLPYVIETDFELMHNPSFRLKSPAKPSSVGDNPPTYQRSLVWYLDEAENDAVVFCGVSNADLSGWSINWSGRLKREELDKRTIAVLKTPRDLLDPFLKDAPQILIDDSDVEDVNTEPASEATDAEDTPKVEPDSTEDSGKGTISPNAFTMQLEIAPHPTKADRSEKGS